MGDLVSDGTSFSCPFCTSKLKISVTSSSSDGDSKKLGNTSNCFFPAPGGKCKITASPCNPSVTNVDPGQEVVQIDGKMALGVGCKFQCAKGGVLNIDSPGQTVAKHESSLAEIGVIAAEVGLAVVAVALLPEELAAAALTEGVATISEAIDGAAVEVAEEEAALVNAKKPPLKNRLAIEPNAQGKHIESHPHYLNELKQKGKNTNSILNHPDPQGLIDRYAGTGSPSANNVKASGEPGYIETVDFKENIGFAVNKETGERTPTTWGKIHYDKQDRVHIVPVIPK